MNYTLRTCEEKISLYDFELSHTYERFNGSFYTTSSGHRSVRVIPNIWHHEPHLTQIIMQAILDEGHFLTHEGHYQPPQFRSIDGVSVPGIFATFYIRPPGCHSLHEVSIYAYVSRVAIYILFDQTPDPDAAARFLGSLQVITTQQ